ncbi:transcription factor TFIIE beta subunit, TFIIEB, Tfa2 [Saitoella coloradoensis]
MVKRPAEDVEIVSVGSPGYPSDPGTPKKKSKKALPIVYSQPADTGSGNHLLTQVKYAEDKLKEKGAPMKSADLFSYLNIHLNSSTHRTLTRLFSLSSASSSTSVKIRYDPASDTYSYAPEHPVHDVPSLVQFLRQRAETTMKGMPIKDLKESWSDIIAGCEQAEQEGKILVLRAQNAEKTLRMAWANTGGELGGIDDEFKNMWNSLRLPPEADVPAELEKFGLKPTSVDPSTVKVKAVVDDKMKRPKRRRGKETNTHMAGILKDYQGFKGQST